MSLRQHNPQQDEANRAIATALHQTGMTGEAIERLVHSSNPAASELGSFMSNTSYGKIARQLGPVCKLLGLVELAEGYQELRQQGHSAAASFIGSGTGLAAGTATFMGGASLATAGVLAAPEAPPVGVAAITGGVLLMHESEAVAKVAKHSTAILVDTTLDKFSGLYNSASHFAREAYQKFMAKPEYGSRKYVDIESAMLDLGFNEHVRELYAHLDQNQQLLYSTVTRDLFAQYFKFNQDKTIRPEPRNRNEMRLTNGATTAAVKADVVSIQARLAKEVEALERSNTGQVDKVIKEQNARLKSCLNELVNQANAKHPGPARASVAAACDPVKGAQEFCDYLNAASQGISLVARVTGNNRLAQQVTHSAVAVSQVVTGIAQIASSGWAAGPVGMALGGINMLISCFGSGDDAGMQAFAEQLAIISSQIHALHEDMLLQFSKVFTALGVINGNIIEGFRLLHEDQKNIFANIVKLQKAVSVLQDSVNALGRKIDALGSELQGYILEDDRKQLQHVFNNVREKARRLINRAELHTQLMAAFKTFNEELIERKLNGEKATAAEISRHLTTRLGSAEANTGLILNFAKNMLGINVASPIADPEQWRQCAGLLIEMTDKASQERGSRAVIGREDYEDFRHLRQIGDNWLAVIAQFKSTPGQQNRLALLFQRYRTQVINLVSLIEKEVENAEQETKKALKLKFTGLDDLEKQNKFNYEFRRNNYYSTATEDWSGCKGFHNAARFMGYDNFAGEWTAHLESRKKDIAGRLALYKDELDAYQNWYKEGFVRYYPNEPHRMRSYPSWHSASAFMVSETSPETSPMLPLPCSQFGLTSYGDNPLSVLKIPLIFFEAELLGLGTIRHVYKFEKNEFVYKIQFQIPGEKEPVQILRFNKACTLADYLNPAEAIWHAYMGGTYPANGSYSLVARICTTPNNDYFVRHHCAVPTFTTTDGLRKTLELGKETPGYKAPESVESMIADKVKRKKAELRKAMNGNIMQQLESPDSRNALAAALLEVDASAKMLIAFISILFRDNYQRAAAVWTRDEIIDFLRNYQNQDVYLMHQLNANLAVLEVVERNLLEKINLQTETAYSTVKDTLVKLRQFMEVYERHVMEDRALAARENAEQNRQAAIYGATQATLVMQTELLNSGHVDAAMHISQLLARSGLGLLSILPPESVAPAQIAYERSRLFPAPGTSSGSQEGDNVRRLNYTPGSNP